MCAERTGDGEQPETPRPLLSAVVECWWHAITLIPLKSRGGKANPSCDAVPLTTVPLATLTSSLIVNSQQMVCKEFLGFCAWPNVGIPASMVVGAFPQRKGREKAQSSGCSPGPLSPTVGPGERASIHHRPLISCLGEVQPEPHTMIGRLVAKCPFGILARLMASGQTKTHSTF